MMVRVRLVGTVLGECAEAILSVFVSCADFILLLIFL
jgi:hypothetical protein